MFFKGGFGALQGTILMEIPVVFNIFVKIFKKPGGFPEKLARARVREGTF